MIIDNTTKLLVISPHPDDEALGVGGLIGLAKKRNAEVLIVYMCVGSSRQLVTTATHTDTRLDEIKDIEQFAKVKTEIFYEGDEFTRLDTVPQKELIEKVEDIIESFKPTVVCIPASTSYNQDHRATYTACITALRPVPRSIRHFPNTVLEYFEPYYWGVTPSKQPNVFIDLSPKYKGGTLLDFKLKLYKCHATQVRKDPFPRSVENLTHIAHTHGKEIGVLIAEGYHLLRDVA